MKRTQHLLLAVAMAAIVAAPAHARLIAHWKLDDGSGTTAADSAFGNDGTLGGTPLPTWISGVDGRLV